jgi:hypothetical protein
MTFFIMDMVHNSVDVDIEKAYTQRWRVPRVDDDIEKVV